MKCDLSESQTASAAILVRPHLFFYNHDTALTNTFQRSSLSPHSLTEPALTEFEAAAAKLESAGVEVIVFNAPGDLELPDAIFPNNWLSTHSDGTVVLYPLKHQSRRGERRLEYLQALRIDYGFRIDRVIDLSVMEAEHEFVEGTGSLVLDRANRVAFASLSPRTTHAGVKAFCAAMSYSAIVFSSVDRAGTPIYHTNVMMGICTDFAVVCLDAVPDPAQRAHLISTIERGGRALVEISLAQMEAFAGNIIELTGKEGAVLAMSERAWMALSRLQQRTLDGLTTVLPVKIPTIEEVGGGGIRCMIAENHLPHQTFPHPVTL
jgi:hypothetical protein